MRFLKAVVFYLVFTALCVALVFTAMRAVAERSGKPELYAGWRSEIDAALAEAGDFLADVRANLKEKWERGSGAGKRPSGEPEVLTNGGKGCDT